MKARTEFTVHLKTEFGLGLDRRKCHLGETPEQTFLNAWKSLPKNQDKRWFSLSFDHGNSSFTVDRQTLRDNRFDFESTVEKTELA